MARPGRISHDTQNRLKGTVVKTYTDTIEPAAEMATESDEERRARYRRERHAALMAGLEELTDLLRAAGPGSDLAGEWGRVTVHAGIYDGTIEERITRLAMVARTIDAEIFERDHNDDVHFRVERTFSAELEYTCAIIATGDDEIAAARAAVAAVAATERITVDYQIEHEPAVASEVRAALAARGVEARTDLAGEDHGRPTVTPNGEGLIFVDNGDNGGGLPALAQCVSLDAYATAIAAYVRCDFDGASCPARPDTAFRAIRADGAVLTVYACGHYHDDADGELIEEGFTVVRLANDITIPTGVKCGHRVELGGAR
jgi:hypothetical protein